MEAMHPRCDNRGHCVAIGLTVIVALAIGIWFAWLLRRIRRAKLKKAFVKRNGGLLFQQIASQDGTTVKAEIFTSEELERATDNFSESRMRGKGGSGTVYKGMQSDGRIVAIKKSHLMHEKQADQFTDEVVVLSEINHRNIVKLLGCCLETEVPLLELHGKDCSFCISWKVRVNIALEIAGALAYLHSATSMPIFHRDIKSSNILLDSNYGTKISDFGISRSIPLEKTHVTTGLQGTFGYLDPEFFHSRQFTDKSDVYSFGLVLLELLTGERAMSRSKVKVEDKSLVLNFIAATKENRLYDILDDRIRHEVTDKEFSGLAMLAKRCLKFNGKKRPTMKEVAIDLERISRLSSLFGPC
ncbi:wall-associated receptor kinase-like 4 [Rhodamnia argentea]|uniref:Wall-associated receptor kinase-like 4 n=1 Tax=Rhodamnia argentea TaxID=178133 RepID=A0A8B8NLH1_9MYRT|nr:wall-associated receptor kinase-like 4 [Rhodamnia argentea]